MRDGRSPLKERNMRRKASICRVRASFCAKKSGTAKPVFVSLRVGNGYFLCRRSGKSKKEDAPSLLYANGSRQQRLEFPAEAQTGVDGGGIRAEKLASRLDLGKEVAGVMQAQTALKEQGVTPRKFSG